MFNVTKFFLKPADPVPNGEVIYTSDGSWTCPAGVFFVSVVCVGNGGGAGFTRAGGLGWKNNIPVVPGTSYPVYVGFTGSFFINDSTVKGTSGYYGGGFVGDGGGNGGYGPNYGGGGAGGYTGDGGSATYAANGSPGSGGGGGGGAAWNTPDYSGTATAPGGGVGLYGQGTSGAGGIVVNDSSYATLYGGKGGSGGADGGVGYSDSAGVGGVAYGGMAGYHPSLGAAANGGPGALRIMWGTGRSFPYNAGYVAP